MHTLAVNIGLGSTLRLSYDILYRFRVGPVSQTILCILEAVSVLMYWNTKAGLPLMNEFSALCSIAPGQRAAGPLQKVSHAF